MNRLIKNYWDKNSYTTKGLIIGFCISTVFYLLAIIIGSIITGDYVCLAFDSVPDCNLGLSILLSILMYLIFYSWVIVIPSIFFGGLIGFIIGEIKKREWKTKKQEMLGFMVGLFVVILVLLYILLVLLEPANHEITQDSILMKNLCKMQVHCEFVHGPYRCYLDRENKELERWTKYNGCNESTEGYRSENDTYGHTFHYIYNVEHCLC